MVEPEFYVPVIPMILVNGVDGIGTGFSCKILPHNPLDLIKIIRRKIDGKEYKEPKPYYRNFEGSITKIDEGRYEIKGNYTIDRNENKIIITEIPVGKSITDYASSIESSLVVGTEKKKGMFEKMVSKSTDDFAYFELHLDEESGDFRGKDVDMKTLRNKFDKLLKIKGSLSSSNMNLLNRDRNISNFKNIHEIIDYYYEIRYEYYIKRKKHMINKLENELNVLKYRIKFIRQVVNNEIKIMRQKKTVIIEKLEKLKYPLLSLTCDETLSYDYLTEMKWTVFTLEKIMEYEEAFKNKDTELNILRNTSIEDMWRSELDEIEKEYKIFVTQNKIDYTIPEGEVNEDEKKRKLSAIRRKTQKSIKSKAKVTKGKTKTNKGKTKASKGKIKVTKGAKTKSNKKSPSKVKEIVL